MKTKKIELKKKNKQEMQRFRNRNFHVVVVILNNSRFCVENTSYDDANDNQNQRNNISFFDEYYQTWGEHCVLERGDVVCMVAAVWRQ